LMAHKANVKIMAFIEKCFGDLQIVFSDVYPVLDRFLTHYSQPVFRASASGAPF